VRKLDALFDRKRKRWWAPKRTVLASWRRHAAAKLESVYLRLRELILAFGEIAVDETMRQRSRARSRGHAK
jgi:hypothetical protein